MFSRIYYYQMVRSEQRVTEIVCKHCGTHRLVPRDERLTNVQCRRCSAPIAVTRVQKK